MLLQHNAIALIGLKSCGKSTVGRYLAKSLQCDFIDTDVVIEKNYFVQYGEQLNFKDIHQKIGELEFRRLETIAIESILEHKKKIIIATGGSSMLHKENRVLLKKNAFIIYLQASVNVLEKRWQKKPPTFINPENLNTELNAYYQQRADLYSSLADANVSVDYKTVKKIVAEINKIKIVTE